MNKMNLNKIFKKRKLPALVLNHFNLYKQYYSMIYSIKTKQKLEELIAKHQHLPGNIFYALLDRFVKKKTE